MEEVGRIPDADLTKLGMTRDQLAHFSRLPADTTERLTAMAALFGLTGQELRRDWGSYLDIVDACGHCGARGRCASHLARPVDAGPAAQFCPNAAAYADLARTAAH